MKQRDAGACSKRYVREMTVSLKQLGWGSVKHTAGRSITTHPLKPAAAFQRRRYTKSRRVLNPTAAITEGTTKTMIVKVILSRWRLFMVYMYDGVRTSGVVGICRAQG